MAEIKWIKITTDIFNDEKISIIEKMPEGDTLLIIWLKLLTLAGKKNDLGFVYLTENIPYTPDILADIFGRDSRLISLALNTFISFGMIEIENDIIKVLNWEKHQNIDGMNKIREQNRLRVAKHRERKQLEVCNVTVTKSNAIDKIRIDKDKIKNKEENKKSNKRFTPPLIEEVEAFFAEKEAIHEYESFHDYYTSNGWMAGRNKMKDWKASARGWIRRSIQYNVNKPEKKKESAAELVARIKKEEGIE